VPVVLGVSGILVFLVVGYTFFVGVKIACYLLRYTLIEVDVGVVGNVGKAGYIDEDEDDAAAYCY
jgi:hypothetical protein